MEAEKLIDAFQSAKNLEMTKNFKETIERYSNFITNCELYLDKSGESNSDSNRSQMIKLLAQAYNNRGFVKYLQVDFDEAIEDYSKGLSFDGSMHYSYYNRGLIQYRLARFDRAIEDMEKALELKPDFEPAQECLQQSLLDREKSRTS